MKKLVKFLVPFLCLNSGLLSSCGNDGRVQLSFGDMHVVDVDDTTTIEIINEKVANKESFLLTVADETCYCWETFRPIIKSYVSDKHVPCGLVTYKYFKDLAFNYGITLVKGTTTFVIFEDGKVKVQVQSSATNTTLQNKDDFYKFMDGTVKLPKAYFISELDYNTVTENGAIIYFERSGCGDCNDLNPMVIAKYVKNHPNMNNIYVLDCQSWKDNLNDADYQAAKDYYGLSIAENPNYGYDSGVFPFLSFVKKGNYVCGAVGFNDTIEKVNGKYKVTNSYYTAERLPKLDYLTNVDTKVIKGLELPASDVSDNGEWISWDNKKAVKYYEPIINGFLDTYLPQVNYKI